jgi:hypothetical protein
LNISYCTVWKMSNVLHWLMNYSSSNGGDVQPSMYYLFYRVTLLFCPWTWRTASFFPIQVPWSGTNKTDIMYSFPGQACDHVPTSNVTSPLHEPDALRTNRPFKCCDSCYRPYRLQGAAGVASLRCRVVTSELRRVLQQSVQPTTLT